MNFLNPLILFGLGAAVLPFIIHLLFRRRPRDVQFPSIRLLEQMKTDRIRRLRLKQLIILLLRTLIVILIILAFARPALRSMFRMNARTAAVIIIDNSASMQYVHNGEKLFDSAVRKAREIVEMLDNDDPAALLLTGGTGNAGTGMTTDKTDLSKVLDTIEPADGTGKSDEIFSRTLEMLNATGLPNREIYYLTDGAVNSLPDSLPNVRNDIRLYTVLLGPEKREGTVIYSFELVNRLIVVGEKVLFRARGINFAEGEDTNIELFVDGERKARVQAERRPDGTIEAELEYTPESPGWYSVQAVVNDGHFESGEVRRLVLHVPRKKNVLIVGATQDDMYYVRKALEPEPELSMFSIRTVVNDMVVTDDIALSDVIILSGVPSLPADIYRTLRNTVLERGAGLIVFTPRNPDASLYENGIFRDIFPLTIEKRVMLSGKPDSAFSIIDWFDLQHPILSGISRDGEFQKPEVRSYLKIQPAGSTSVIARFNDGSMAVGEALSGEGHVVVFAVDATSGGSDLPLTGIFVPLVLRTVQYLSNTFISGGNYTSGELLAEMLPDVPYNTSISIKSENGMAQTVAVSYTGSGTIINEKTAGNPGFYTIFTGPNELSRYCVNTSPSEVRFLRAGKSTMEHAYSTLNWKTINDSENLVDFVKEDRYGTELFSLFIMLAIVVTGVEMALSRKL